MKKICFSRKSTYGCIQLDNKKIQLFFEINTTALLFFSLWAATSKYGHIRLAINAIYNLNSKDLSISNIIEYIDYVNKIRYTEDEVIKEKIIGRVTICNSIEELVNILLQNKFLIIESRLTDYNFHEVYINILDMHITVLIKSSRTSSFYFYRIYSGRRSRLILKYFYNKVSTFFIGIILIATIKVNNCMSVFVSDNKNH